MGTATLTEASSDGAGSAGQAVLRLFSKYQPPTADFPSLELSGRYDARLTPTGQCWLALMFGEPTPPGPVSAYSSPQIGGALAFEGAVILFLFHDDPRLNLTVGVRSEFLVGH
jgi:hypothetical protein